MWNLTVQGHINLPSYPFSRKKQPPKCKCINRVNSVSGQRRDSKSTLCSQH